MWGGGSAFRVRGLGFRVCRVQVLQCRDRRIVGLTEQFLGPVSLSLFLDGGLS